jgi:hypothetical protein
MAITLTTGTVAAIASTYGSSVTMSAITNAAEAVATLAASHGVGVGDYLEVTSGWGRLDKKIVRAKTVATNDVTFESINTSNTTTFPAGSGTGSIRRITAWTNLTQVQGSATSGGDLQFTDITTIEDTVQKQAPTVRGAVTVNLTVFDDPSLSWYSAVTTADDARTPYAVRFSFPNSSKLVANAYWNLQRTPSFATNDSLKTQIGLTFVADPVRYST